MIRDNQQVRHVCSEYYKLDRQSSTPDESKAVYGKRNQLVVKSKSCDGAAAAAAALEIEIAERKALKKLYLPSDRSFSSTRISAYELIKDIGTGSFGKAVLVREQASGK